MTSVAQAPGVLAALAPPPPLYLTAVAHVLWSYSQKNSPGACSTTCVHGNGMGCRA